MDRNCQPAREQSVPWRAVVQPANAQSRNAVLAFLIATFFAEHGNKIGVAFFVGDLGAAAVTVLPGCAVQPNRTGTVLTPCAFEM